VDVLVFFIRTSAHVVILLKLCLQWFGDLPVYACPMTAHLGQISHPSSQPWWLD